jgi:hypothetical protein
MDWLKAGRSMRVVDKNGLEEQRECRVCRVPTSAARKELQLFDAPALNLRSIDFS